VESAQVGSRPPWDVAAVLLVLWASSALRVGWVIWRHQEATTEVLLAELVIFVAPVLVYHELSARRQGE
jgi:hypothetical protein